MLGRRKLPQVLPVDRHEPQANRRLVCFGIPSPSREYDPCSIRRRSWFAKSLHRYHVVHREWMWLSEVGEFVARQCGLNHRISSFNCPYTSGTAYRTEQECCTTYRMKSLSHGFLPRFRPSFNRVQGNVPVAKCNSIRVAGRKHEKQAESTTD